MHDIAKNTFNMGISDYIRIKRIDEAKKLLSDTKKLCIKLEKKQVLLMQTIFQGYSKAQ